MNSLLRFLEQAEEAPKRVCLIEKGRRITYRDLSHRAALAQERLQNQGIGKGDQVLILQPMSISLYVILIALWGLGAIPVFLDAGFFKSHSRRLSELLQLKGLIAGSQGMIYSYASAPLRKIPLKLHTGQLCASLPSWHRPRLICRDVTAAHPGLITLTSGSTGEPKIAERSHGFLQIQNRMLGEALEYVPGEIEMATMPVFALSNIGHGLTTVIPSIDFSQMGSFNAGKIWQELEKYNTTRIMAAPGFLQRITDHALASGLRNEKVVAIHTGGAPIFTSLLEQLRQVFPVAQLIAVYGSTEAEPIAIHNVTVLSPAELEHIAAGGGLPAGKVLEAVECRILPNSAGEPIPDMSEEEFEAFCLQSGIGEIVVAGDNVLPGYLYGRGDKENKFSVAGRRFHRTGDLGYFDAKGHLWLVGRAKEAARDERGEVYPLSVEAAAKAVLPDARLAFLQHDGKRVLVLESSNASDPGEDSLLKEKLSWACLDAVTRVERIPVDSRHGSKIDYPRLRKLLK